jgi:hypothetical protein
MGITYTKNFNLTKGRPGIPRIQDANLEIIDEALAEGLAYPFVPAQPRVPERDGNGGVEDRQQNSISVGIKSLEVGPGLVLRDQGDGCFIIELADKHVFQEELNAKKAERDDAKRT